MKLSNAAQRFLEFLTDTGTGPRTVQLYSYKLKLALDFLGPDEDVRAVRAADIARLLKSKCFRISPRTGRARAPRTVKQATRVIRMFFLWAHRAQLISSVPLPKSETPQRVRRLPSIMR